MLEELVLHRGLAVRDQMVNANESIMDVHYHDLMADPIGTVQAISDRFDIPFDESSRSRVKEFLEKNPQTKHGVHRYSPEDFGFDKDRLHERFGFYMRRFGVEAES